MKDCTTCKYGYEDERLGIQMCHHPKRFSEDCIDFNMHEEKEIKGSEKPMNPEDAMKKLDEKIALVKQRGTWDGVDVDKYMDEVRGREPEKPMKEDLEKAVVNYFEGYWPGMETAEQCNTDLRFTPPAIMRLARHFAQWGAEHLKK